jgi:hypothetical protein
MAQRFGLIALGLLLCAVVVQGQQGIQQGKLKMVDPERSVITIAADGKDREFRVTPKTLFLPGDGRPIPLDLKDKRLKEGSAIQFKAGVGSSRESILIGLRLAGKKGFPGKPFTRVDTSGLKPLTEMAGAEYKGQLGGLYPGGKNQRPAAHEKAGRALARKVRPLDAEGKPSHDGKMVLLSVGMSNTTQVFSAFKRLADADRDKNPKLILVDGAQGGMSADRIVDPEDNRSGTRFWQVVDQRLKAAGVTRFQVQAAWIKQADPGPRQGFPGYARTLQKELERIVQVLHERFPNLKLVYLSSRTYGGYARTPLNPEPYAYESGFSVRWLIEKQLKGDPALNYDPAKGAVRSPWLSWGPYLWANGTSKRADGFYYLESDFGPDGTHPSVQGRQKVASELLRFFKNNTTTQPWFLAQQ